MKDFFLAAASLELMQTNDALSYYSHLLSMGFNSTYVKTQLALVYYHQKGNHLLYHTVMISLCVIEFHQSAMTFSDIRKLDPYTFFVMDIYSHVLFVLVS